MTVGTTSNQTNLLQRPALTFGIAGVISAEFVNLYLYQPVRIDAGYALILQTYAAMDFIVAVTLVGVLAVYWRPQVAGVLFTLAGLGGFIVVEKPEHWLVPGAVILTAAVLAWRVGREHST